jgi:hypothetical protein
MHGTCRLCLNTRELRDSHIVPKWAYKQLRGSGKNPNPVVIRGGVAAQTSRQDTESLLCSECEQRFGDVERRISRLVYQDRDRKPELLHQIGSVAHTDGTWRAAHPGSLNTADLVFFGTSVIWRASLSSIIRVCNLGERYENEFRAYLRGGPFPENAACVIAFYDSPLAIGTNLTRVCIPPETEKHSGYHAHRFLVHGLFYYLHVGNQIPEDARFFCAHRSPDRFILLGSQEDVKEWMRSLVLNATKIGSLARQSGSP